MFFGFDAFSKLGKVRGLWPSLGGPNYARYRREATFFFSSRARTFFLAYRAVRCARRPFKRHFFSCFLAPHRGNTDSVGALFGWQIGLPKREHSKPDQNVQREKRTPNLSIPLSLVRRWLEFADDWSTRVGLSKNCAKFGKSFQIATKLCDFSQEKNEPK